MAAGAYEFNQGAVTTDVIAYAAASRPALSLAKFLLCLWARPNAGGSSGGRMFGRCASGVTSSLLSHMQLMVGVGIGAGSRSQDFTGRTAYATTAPQAASAGAVLLDDTWAAPAVHHDASQDFGFGSGPVRILKNGVVLTPASTAAAAGAQDMRETDAVFIGNNGTGAGATRNYQGRIGYIGIWNTATLTNAEVVTLAADVYAGGAGSGVTVPRQDVLVEWIPLDQSGATDGLKGVLTGATVTGAAFTASGPPVEFLGLGAGPEAVPARVRGGAVRGGV